MRTRSQNEKAYRRKRRVREHIAHGTAERPRICVFRSNSHIYLQFIDDSNHKTLFSFSSLSASKNKQSRASISVAKSVGLEAAALAKKNGVQKAVFDRGSYRYHGRVEAVVAGLREGGLSI